MKHAKIWLLLLGNLIFLFGCKNSKEIVVKLDDECLPVVSEFFNKVQKGNYNEALDNLLQSNSNIDPNDSGTIDLKQKFEKINAFSGKYTGYKILRKRGIESDIAVYMCLVKYQRKFYRFWFTFYKAENVPEIYKFSFDDEMDIELEESLKLYLQ